MQIGVFQVVYLGASADEAYQRVQPLQPFAPFRDASCGPPSFNLSVQHCIQVTPCCLAITHSSCTHCINASCTALDVTHGQMDRQVCGTVCNCDGHGSALCMHHYFLKTVKSNKSMPVGSGQSKADRLH